MRLCLLIFCLSVLGIFVACTTNEVQPLNDTMLPKGHVGEKVIGIEDGKVIIKTETDVDDELRAIQWTNENLQRQVNEEHVELQSCQDDLSDPRLGGSGNIFDLPETHQVNILTAEKEKIGLKKDGSLKVVKKQSFIQRLQAERKKQESLQRIIKMIKKSHRKCKISLRRTRLAHGLPGEKQRPKGYYLKDGTWVETEKGENSLDDAFEESARRKAKSD